MKNKKNNDNLVFTYPSRIHLTKEGKSILHMVGTFLGTVRNDDYSYIVSCYRKDKDIPSKLKRRSRLMEKYGVSKREADYVVYSNSEQYQLALRTSRENIRDWNKEISHLRKKLPTLHGLKKKNAIDSISVIEKKIRLSSSKSPSCCFGGSKLQRKITQNYWDDSLKEDWNNKRLFLEFMGESGKTCGNDTIKLNPKTGELSIKISSGMQRLLKLDKREYALGEVAIKYGKKNVQRSIEERIATTYQFQWYSNKKVWRLHVITRVEKERLHQKHGISNIPGRACGIDQNSGFVSCTIVDKYGNPIAQRDFYHSHSKDIQTLVNSIYLWLKKNHCDTVYIENLKGLSMVKRQSMSNIKALNRTVNKIPYHTFSTLLKRKMDICGGGCIKVSPYNTSKNTQFWNGEKYGKTIHQKASYLIARRGMKLSTLPRHIRKSPQDNSVCLGVSHSKNGAKLVDDVHDSRINNDSACSDL